MAHPYKGHKKTGLDWDGSKETFRAELGEWLDNYAPRTPDRTSDQLSDLDVIDRIQRAAEEALQLRIRKEEDRTSVSPASIRKADSELRNAIGKVNELVGDGNPIDVDGAMRSITRMMINAIQDGKTIMV